MYERDVPAPAADDKESGDLKHALFAPYCPIDGAFDEMRDASGAMRPHWRAFVEMMEALGPAEIERRANAAAQRLREAGVYFRAYDRNQEQPWPLSATPVLIGADEWRGIEAGLVQRASLIEAALADFYGDQRLVRDGDMPAALLAGSPDFLRPMIGAKPRGGRYLSLYAADLGRGPDGRWWILRDRTQAPSGAGYALGNRIALSRTLPETMRDLGVARLADFFQESRRALQSLSAPDSAGVCLLTPGPYNDTYYEHAYLARYLGFLLVEGEDLVVRNGEAFLRTVGGLKKVDVLLRRLDADFVDPMELNPNSRLGAPGIVDATRSGKLAFANALGSGVAESRALMSFWPKLARKLLGDDLQIPNVATWWCGQEPARNEVLGRLEDFAIAPAFQGNWNGLFKDGAIEGDALTPGQRADLVARMQRRGMDFVGQEMVTLSTTPVWDRDHFAPRPFQLRVFVAATADGWRVMPGAFCRVSAGRDPRAISMQRGGLSADAWVLADQPGPLRSLLPSPETVTLRRTIGALTTRTADNLFWLGRYLERADATLRLVRAVATRTTERDSDVANVAERMTELMAQWGAIDEKAKLAPALAAQTALYDQNAFGAPSVLVQRGFYAASITRDRLSPDAWITLNQLSQLMRGESSEARGDDLDRIERALRKLSAFAGYEQENMTRGAGWAILEIGRRIERGLAIARYIHTLGLPDATPAALEALLEMADSQITYAQRYFVTLSPVAVADLLIFDDRNPRSCAYQAARLRELADRLPELPQSDDAAMFRKSVVLLDAAIAGADPRQVDKAFVARLDDAFLAVANAFASLYLSDREHLAS